ncbi:MAG: ABC transporter ATP-binding protein [Pseudomonadales bacterium]|nr:ABC transporter ATP-binding protein [Pseudomonadales bacterium]
MKQNHSAVEIKDLNFRWHPQAEAVLALSSLKINRAERVFIEGPSGSGKSTLLSLLAGVTVPQKGTVTVLNQQLDKLSNVQRDRFRSHHIGYIFQMFNLIPYLSMVDNVLLPCRFSKARHDKALQRSATIEDEAIRLLSHLDMAHSDLLKKSVTSLSVGQQQRVAAARALMGAPEILIADEPTSSLDTHRRESFVQLLFQECDAVGSTLVFVSHDTSLKGLFGRTINLTDINATSSANRER